MHSILLLTVLGVLVPPHVGAVPQAYSYTPTSGYWFPPFSTGGYLGDVHGSGGTTAGGEAGAGGNGALASGGAGGVADSGGGIPNPGAATVGSGAGGSAAAGGGDKTKVVAIIKDERSGPGPSGTYSFSYEAEDGSARSESGSLNDQGVMVQTGEYSYTLPDGQKFTLSYVADSGGFQPKSSFLPPVPAFVQQQIEVAKKEDAAAEGGRGTAAPVGGVMNGAAGGAGAAGVPGGSKWPNEAGATAGGRVGPTSRTEASSSGGAVAGDEIGAGSSAGFPSGRRPASWTGAGASDGAGGGLGPPAWIPLPAHAGAGASVGGRGVTPEILLGPHYSS